MYQEILHYMRFFMFADKAKITIKSGKGGDGHVSFRREKYVPDGGPNGGDGGNGGSIIFVPDQNINTLIDYRHKRKYVAESGEEGGGNRCHGKSGKDLILKVPFGTLIRDAETNLIIHDMSIPGEEFVILKGGHGGKGNMHYATATMQAPKYAQPGGRAKELEVLLELKVIADVGLVGFPSVGKSTFLACVTNARPKIADYHFTTLEPNLGVVDLDDTGFVIADIPGLIEGASDGVGLGHEFLKHIERCKVIIHLVDGASVEGRDPIDDILKINAELSKYSDVLTKKKQIIAVNKMDLIYDEAEKEAIVNKMQETFGDNVQIFPISAATKAGVKPLLYAVKELLDSVKDEDVIFESEFNLENILTELDEPFTVEKLDDETYSVEGPRIERMLGYTNLESEKGFMFFQNFMKDNGIIDEMLALGMEEGDTVKVYGHEFEYYK